MLFIGLVRLCSIILLIINYFLTAGVLQLFFFNNRSDLNKTLIKLINRYCQVMLYILNIEVEIVNKDGNAIPSSTFFYVSNHLSYLDVIILFAFFPSCFITSREVKETPFLGAITTLAGCIFVERRNKIKIENEVKEIEDALKNNLSIFVFPEATSTNGESVKTFKRPLFNAAINTQTPVMPLTINYVKISNESINRNNRDKIFWYGDMTFFKHFIRLMFVQSIKANVVISEKIHPHGHDKTTLASLTNKIVEQAYIPLQ